MANLHIVQGGIDNGDMKWLERAAGLKRSTPAWVMPRCAEPGDEVVIYIGGHGFFATARVTTKPIPRTGWTNRYGGGITDVELITPAISLGAILRHLPALSWARYPKTITTPSAKVANSIRALISKRRESGLPDSDDAALDFASVAELRALALAAHGASTGKREATRRIYPRSTYVHRYVLARANGTCEGCCCAAPFTRADGSPYLEPHHTTRVADDGPDHPAHVIALCPNCHRRAHSSQDRETFGEKLERKLAKLEPE
jgi:hypothetical protein